jgi:cell division protein FtsB
VIVCAVLAVVGAGLLEYSYIRFRNLEERHTLVRMRQAELESQREELKRLQTEWENAQKRKENLGADPVEIEATLRRIKQWVKPGETIYRIPVQEPPSHAPLAVPVEGPQR